MTMKHLAKILFFIVGPVPTESDYEEADKIGGNVVFRNASVVPATGALEACDGVAGAVPERYAEAYPEAEDAVEAVATKRKTQAAKLGEVPAPVAKPAKAAKASAATPKTWGGNPNA